MLPRLARSGVLPILLAFGLAVVPWPAAAENLLVPQQHATIAAALAASQPGDKVVVQAGVYLEGDLALVSGVTLLGAGDAPEDVVIDAGGSCRALHASHLPLPVNVVNLTIKGGRAQGACSIDGSGAGLLARGGETNLLRVRFVGNEAQASGGAVRAMQGALTLVDCVLTANRAGAGGGAVEASYGARLEVRDSAFHLNQAAWGGALAVRGDATAEVQRSTLSFNTSLQYPALGGALHVDHGARADLAFCSLVDNTALFGGGAAVATEGVLTLGNCTVRRNEGVYDGGGLYVKESDPVLDHTVVAGNVGRAVRCASGGRVAVLAACDLWGNLGGDWVGPIAAQRNDAGNFSDDPRFCSADEQALREDSPCLAENNDVGLVGAGTLGCSPAAPPDHAETAEAAAVVALEGEPLAITPNPFNPRTQVSFLVAEPRHVRLSVVDLRGRVVVELVDGPLPRGRHDVVWQAEDRQGRPVPSGTYLMVLEAGGRALTRRAVVLR